MSDRPVVVIGGGPAGSAAAYWLARDGHQVILAEKKEHPRDKTCGDGLTPRAIYWLEQMGFDFGVTEFHRITGLRSYAGEELFIEMKWPDHSRYPNWGGVIRRRDLDSQVADLARKQGADLHEKTEAVPVLEGGQLVAVDLQHQGETRRIEPSYVVIADGSMNRFGRELGSVRRKD